MSKQQLIDQIRLHNPTAANEFLAEFDEPALNQYLDHLRFVQAPRGRQSVWVRHGETAAVVTRARPGD